MRATAELANAHGRTTRSNALPHAPSAADILVEAVTQPCLLILKSWSGHCAQRENISAQLPVKRIVKGTAVVVELQKNTSSR